MAWCSFDWRARRLRTRSRRRARSPLVASSLLGASASISSEQGNQDQDDTHGCSVPDKRPDQTNAKRIERDVRDASDEVEFGPVDGHPTVTLRDTGYQHRGGEKRKRLREVAERPLEPTCHTLKWRHDLVARARGPSISMLATRRVRAQHNLNKAQHGTENEHLKLNGHVSLRSLGRLLLSASGLRFEECPRSTRS